MNEPVIIGNAQLYHGDCMEVLPSLCPVDAIITDPPYEADAHTNARRLLTKGQDGGRGRAVGKFEIDFSAMDNRMRKQVGRDCQRLCSGWGLYFCQIEAVYLWRIYLQSVGAKWRRGVIWRKPDGAPQFTGDRPGMGFESIAAVWHGEGKSIWNGGGKHGVYEHGKHDAGRGHGRPKNEHQTQKPIRLMEALVSDFTPPAALVLDPFMGSGSTGVACGNLGRAFIGVEKDAKHFDTACRRIEDGQRQTRMFA